MSIRRYGPAAAMTLALVLGGGAVAHADAGSPEDLPEPTRQQLAASVQVWEPGNVRRWDPSGSVDVVEQVETDGEATVISLATDILFTVNSWELPGTAADRIVALAEDVPDGARVTVTGHTDSQPTGEDFGNQELSERRAEAVAEALRAERPDLELEVSGAGESDPAVSEDPEDPSTFAANRRVEISYTG